MEYAIWLLPLAALVLFLRLGAEAFCSAAHAEEFALEVVALRAAR